MLSPLHHLTAEQFAGLLSYPETQVTSLLMPGFACQEGAQSSGVLQKEPLSTSLIETWSEMVANEDNEALGQVAQGAWGNRCALGFSRPS